ncbi:MAG: CHAP domain-containing protein [Myxococcaceae bacterium]
MSSLAKVDPGVPDDCTGLVRSAYEAARIELLSADPRVGENGVTWIWRGAKERRALREGVPRPGDLVFFRETYDRNRDGRRNDGLTHIGVVERADAQGNLTFIHRSSAGVVRARLNAFRPTEHRGASGR